MREMTAVAPRSGLFALNPEGMRYPALQSQHLLAGSVIVIEASLTYGGPWAMVRTLMFQLAISIVVPLSRFHPSLRRSL